ncbi:MAG: CotH kinase family protein [Chloroflexi bacterium]|nr:CotH kinase family protein [Chloroflexota bacterium]MCI0580654.1 CotH kinase family protein [Chloroflexota bacterium]MCI0648670.1 CotH kinase family protein [Chloroflexota bacterium]MCI0728078.1 CotH kinase family protein [Chloroflexota bacterium]
MNQVTVSNHQRLSPHLAIILGSFLILLLWQTGWLAARPSLAAGVVVEAPRFSHPGGYYAGDLSLAIQASQPGATILFSTDGSLPTLESGQVYTQPLHLSAAAPIVTVVRARTILPDGELGEVATASYLMGVEATLPLVSLIIDPADWQGPERGIFANANEKGPEWERPAHITFVDEERRDGFMIVAGVRVHGGASRTSPKKSLRLYFRQEYGQSRLEYPLFAGEGTTTFKRLILHNGGQDMAPQMEPYWTLMRNPLVSQLAWETRADATRGRPVLLFLNGEPMGVYFIRERLDARFLAARYNLAEADFLDTPERVLEEGPRIESGNRRHWDHLMAFVATHDLADPASYTYVQSQLDLDNLIDYTILQLYAGNVDWPNSNVHQFRSYTQGGRWHWLIFDGDHSFGYPTRWNSVNANLVVNALVADPDPSTTGRHTLLLQHLMANPLFFERFLTRAADLLNTAFAPETVTAEVDALAAALAPNMTQEALVWANPYSWERGVAYLRDFAGQRPELLRQQLVAQYNLPGTARLSFSAPATGVGAVAVNGQILPELPWEGVYFQGTTITVTAVPRPGFRFAGWEEVAGEAVLALPVAGEQRLTPRFAPLDVEQPWPGDVDFAGYGLGDERQAGWLALEVVRPGGVDLRGWRVTDNDGKTATDEGSLIFAAGPALAAVPEGTTILIVLGCARPPADCPPDDLDADDGRLVLTVGNQTLDNYTDPGFRLGLNDSLALLAPGPGPTWADDQGIAMTLLRQGLCDYCEATPAVSPADFGILADGVWESP